MKKNHQIKLFGMLFIVTASLYSICFTGCAGTACDKAQQLRWKAMQASTEAEKQNYEAQAKLFDENCAQENNAKYQEEKDRKLRSGGK
jgi:hypothetical protein